MSEDLVSAPGAKMEAEIAQQSSLLSSNGPAYFKSLSEAFEGHEFESVLIVARGSSDNVATYLRYLIEIYLEVPVVLGAPSVWTRYGKNPRYYHCLAIGISQSGAAPDVSEVITRMRSFGHKTLAITNVAGSALSQAAEHTLLLNTGPETSVAATKTFTASMLAAYELVRALGGALGAPIVPDESWLETCRSAAREHAPAVVESHPIFVLGRGLGFATALEASLKLMECADISAKGYSAADFQHGPKALAGPQSAIVTLEPDPALQDVGAKVLPAPTVPVDEPMLAIWQAIYCQYLALEVSRLKGLDADAPRYLSKVTKTL